MIDFNEPRNLLVGVFALICLIVGISVAMNARKGQMGKAFGSFAVVLIGVAIAALGPAVLILGPRILGSLGLSTS